MKYITLLTVFLIINCGYGPTSQKDELPEGVTVYEGQLVDSLYIDFNDGTIINYWKIPIEKDSLDTVVVGLGTSIPYDVPDRYAVKDSNVNILEINVISGDDYIIWVYNPDSTNFNFIKG